MTEQIYDDQIAPALLELANKCKDLGMSMVAVVEHDAGKCGATMMMQKDAGLEMIMVSHCAKMGRNIDGYFIGLAKYMRENDIDASASIFMRDVV